MLGARTKQVFSYGRRNRRIVNDSQDPFDDVEDTKRTPVSRRIREPIGNGHALIPTFSPHVSSNHRPKKRRGDSKLEPAPKRRSVSGSGRQPLSAQSANVSRQSALGGPSKKPSLSGSHGASRALLPQSPVISVDIIVLDENGRRLSLEKRSKSKVQVNQKKTLHRESPAYRQATATSVIVVSDSDDDDSGDAPSLQLTRRAKRWPKVAMSSDEEDASEPPIYLTSSPTSPDFNPSPKSTLATSDILKCPTPHHPKLTLPHKPPFWVEIVSPRPPALSQSRPQALPLFQCPPEPSRGKPRQLTPMRRKGSTFTQIPPSPSTPTDISFDFEGLTLSSISYEDPTPTNQPAHLLSLLDECGQIAPVEFSAFIEAFPVHPIVQSTCSGLVAFQKIGEASYSEVFGIGDIVLKIIPIRDEEFPIRDGLDTPAPSDAKDILREIVVTRALGEMCNGFVSLLKTYVVRGRYPSLLLDLWDEYNQTKGSESVRPGATVPTSQQHLQCLNWPRHVGRIPGVCNYCIAQRWARFGSIHVQSADQGRLEAGLQPLLADCSRSCNGRRPIVF
jgi:serine/threonine-protein kinase haspin